MIRFALLICALLLAGCGNHGSPTAAAESGQPVAIVNPGFEQAGSTGVVPGWIFLQHAGVRGYEAALDTGHPYSGQQSARIQRLQPQVFGSLVQRVDANALKGKTVELSAMLRSKDVGPKGFKLYLNGGRPNTVKYSAGVTGTTGWQRQAVQLKVPATVHELTLGVTLLDSGSGWVDDVRLQVIDN